MEGLDHEIEKKEEGGCKRQGVGKENSQGRIRVWSRVCFVGLLGQTNWASLSHLKTFIFLAN